MKRHTTWMIVLVTLAMLLSACSSKNTPAPDSSSSGSSAPATSEPAPAPAPEPPKPKELTFGVSLDKLFLGRQAEMKGVEAAAAEAGVKLQVSVADGDPQQQNAQIQTFINQKVDAILVVAVDQAAIATATKAAADAGIPVVTFDRELPGDPSVKYHTGLDSYSDGLACGKYIASFNDGQPHKVLELLGALNDQNAIDRSKGFEDGLKDAANLEIIKAPTDWNADKALASTENAFQANPDIWAIFIPSDFMMSSIETALKGANRFAKNGEASHVYSCAIDGSQPGYDATVAAWNDGVVALQLGDVGRGAFEAAKTLATGGSLSDTKKGFPGTLFTFDNIADHKAEIWGAAGN